MNAEAQERIKASLHKFNLLANSAAVYCIVASMIPILGYGVNQSHYTIVEMVFYFSHSFNSVIFYIIYTPVIDIILLELDKSISSLTLDNHQSQRTNKSQNDRVLEICRILKGAKYVLTFCVMAFFTFFILVGSMSYLLRKSVYIQICMTLVFHIVSFMMLTTVSNFAAKIKVYPSNTSHYHNTRMVKPNDNIDALVSV